MYMKVLKNKKKKVKRIADKYGWDVTQKYKDDPITENSGENQRLWQAEAKAEGNTFDRENYNSFRDDYNGQVFDYFVLDA